MTGFITLTSKGGRPFEAFLATPETPNGGGLVILPEVYNVNAWARGVAARYAAQGYTVLVPDLFWRQEPGVHLDYDQPERARAQGEEVDVDGVVSDLGPLAAWLRARLGEGARVGVVGFCLGGRIALLGGVREPVDAVVSYYGVKLDQHLDELGRLTVPALVYFGADDPWIPAETVNAVKALFRQSPNVSFFRYAGTGHGFAREGYAPYRPAAAALAEQRALELFADKIAATPT
ncbi:dienelactone hydrolase family protein [Chelatococcus reniformis]|uniref:Carboxymethylenebutenolidase n=1 Tax=Chelatococcus reniformis TaxID=1494448 RepID=A0A916U9G3_9HYPH|nr:dienelactone hydrolase family protein [Chelatococcus reniformis]GGC65466.1 carboxymethylenebutenolidase [Chelatococcus reniformis]